MASFRERRPRNGRLDIRELERLYGRYNRRSLRSSDPVEFVHRYSDARDREIAGMLASSLAFGGVAQIRASAARALEPLGDSPAAFLAGVSPARLGALYRGFRHRWITGDDLAGLLEGMRGAIAAYGSLGALFEASIGDGDLDAAAPSERFVDEIRHRGRPFRSCLLPSPRDGSACKRLFLFLRWMVRRDEIDTGLWSHVPPSMLIVPLDTHLHRTALRLGLTSRAAADLRTAREVTERFRSVAPQDPVRYDFALAHEGMSGAARKERCHV